MILFLSLSPIVCAVSEFKLDAFIVPNLQEVIRTIILREGQSVSGTVEASSCSGSGINFYITDPQGIEILRDDHATNASFSFSASFNGSYIMHFDNRFSQVAPKMISLDVTIQDQIKPIYLGIIPITFGTIAIIVVVIAIAIGVLILVITRRKRYAPVKPQSELAFFQK